MAKTIVGLAMSSTMFSGDVLISRKMLSADEAKSFLSGGEVISCCNPSHSATLAALREKYTISVPISETAPKVSLEPGDTLLVLSARFSRRLAEGEKYSPEEVAAANFEFVAYRLLPAAALAVIVEPRGETFDVLTGKSIGILTL